MEEEIEYKLARIYQSTKSREEFVIEGRNKSVGLNREKLEFAWDCINAIVDVRELGA